MISSSLSGDAPVTCFTLSCRDEEEKEEEEEEGEEGERASEECSSSGSSDRRVPYVHPRGIFKGDPAAVAAKKAHKHAVKEEQREKRKNKVPKHVKKRREKLGRSGRHN